MYAVYRSLVLCALRVPLKIEIQFLKVFIKFSFRLPFLGMRMGKTLMSCKLKKIIESADRDGSSGWVHTLDNESIYKETDGWVNVVVHYKKPQMAKKPDRRCTIYWVGKLKYSSINQSINQSFQMEFEPMCLWTRLNLPPPPPT